MVTIIIVLTVLLAVCVAMLLSPNVLFAIHKRWFIWRRAKDAKVYGDELKAVMGCPLCSGLGHLNTQKVELKFKDVNFVLDGYGYVCDRCGEDWTDTHTDQATMNLLHREYARRTKRQ